MRNRQGDDRTTRSTRGGAGGQGEARSGEREAERWTSRARGGGAELEREREAERPGWGYAEDWSSAREPGRRDFGGRDFGEHDFGERVSRARDFRERDFGDRGFGGRDFGWRDFGDRDLGERELGGRAFGEMPRFGGHPPGSYGIGHAGPSYQGAPTSYGEHVPRYAGREDRRYAGREDSRYAGREEEGWPGEAWGRGTGGPELGLELHGHRVVGPDERGIVRGPHYGKGPKGYKRSDERILEDVCELISRQGDVDASDVEVRVESGVVTLSGTVDHRQDKRALEQLTERCHGVDDVRNELRVRREGRSLAGEQAPRSAHGGQGGTGVSMGPGAPPPSQNGRGARA